MSKTKNIKLTYLITEKTKNPINFLDFPVDWRDSEEKPKILYRDEKGREYSIQRVMPYPPKNKAFFQLLNSPAFTFTKEDRIIKGKIESKKEQKDYGARIDLPIDIEGTIAMKKGKNIIVIDNEEMWVYNFEKEY